MKPPAVLASRYVHLYNFLPPDRHGELLDYVARREADFVGTTTTTGEQNYRRSQVLHEFPEFSSFIVDRIKSVLPDVWRQARLDPFAIGQIEAQLTAHNDGHFYKLHNDSGSPETASRQFTYVYYFYRQPKPFSGGELVIYDSKIENNFYVKADSYQIVEPRNNSIVFFLSRYIHEVLPVRCPSRSFADSRFTINGWIRQG